MRRVTGESGMARKTDTYHYTMETDAAVTAMLMDGRLTCEERDAISLGDTSHRGRQERPLHWVPYIHFGI